MALKAIFLYIAASYGRVTSNTNNRHPEIGRLEIVPEDTLEPCDYRNDLDDDDDALNEDVDDADDDDPLDLNPRRFRRFSSIQTAVTSFSRSFTFVDQPTWFQKFKYFVFPPKEDIESFIPNYRYIPILSGFLIPFCILLEIPGLTQHWYVRTENNQVIEQRANPVILDVGVGISLACAVIANLCLITRFLERRVKTMTILCAAFLTFHDLINIVTVTIFGVVHRFSDGFTYGQPFWMTVCSTIASSFTNATLLWDLYRTPDFNKCGSGLTRRQRTLVIIVMVFFCYTCIGALINSLILKLSFIDGLYFTLVSIESIGFGDIVATTTGSRLFVCAYSTIGFVNLGVAIAMCRETILEAMEVAYKKRASRIKERWKEARKRRRVEARWRRGIEWRLKEMGMPVWIHDENWMARRTVDEVNGKKRVTIKWQNTPGFIRKAAEWAGFTKRKLAHSQSMHGPSGMRLNLEALTHTQLEASALEAGVPLSTLLPSDFVPAEEAAANGTDTQVEANSSASPGWIHHPLASHFENAFHPTQARNHTHAKLGGMSALLTRFGVAAVHTHATALDKPFSEGGPPIQTGRPVCEAVIAGATPNLQIDPSPTIETDKDLSHLGFNSMPARSSDKLILESLQDLDKKAFYTKLIIAWSLFFIFWAAGSAIFVATEGWSYGISMYFCFVAFTTIGYGDYHPDTPAGRSIFVVWAILGVGTMTILISVIQEAYSSRYKSAVHIRAFDKAIKRYRQRVQYSKPIYGRRGRRLHIRGHHPLADLPSNARGKVRSTSRSPSVNTLSHPQDAAEKQKEIISDSTRRAQECLEALPRHVLRHAKTFHTYVQLFVDDGNILGTRSGGSTKAMTHGGMAEISGSLRKLLDEIATLGGIGKATEQEILQDPDAKHTLFVLSIEKALHRMIDAAEEALEAVEERDELTTQVRKQHVSYDEPDPEEDIGSCSKVPESIPAAGEVGAPP